jgi:hypothetical protein
MQTGHKTIYKLTATILVGLGLFVFAGQGKAQAAAAWNLTFSDEFNGGQLNTGVWHNFPFSDSPGCISIPSLTRRAR